MSANAVCAADMRVMLPEVTRELSLPRSSSGTSFVAMKSFLKLLPNRPSMNAPSTVLNPFVLALMERKWGSNENLVLPSTHSASSSSSLPVGPPSDPLALVVDAILKFLKLQPLSAVQVDALYFVTATTDKPYVRDQAFKFFFEWSSALLESLSAVERVIMFQLPTQINISSADKIAKIGDEFDEFDDFDAADDDDDHSDSGDGNLSNGAGDLSSSLLTIIEAGLTDVWSAIRKTSAKKLKSIVALLGIANVRPFDFA